MSDLILVDENDNQIGKMEKLETHQKGKLHRAFSIFVFNSNNELLIQKRADCKYHCPGLWANTVCGHPNDGETTSDGAHRRLFEEMGIKTPLTEKFVFSYKVLFDNDLTENEVDHVFVGITDDTPNLNPEEVSEYLYDKIENIIVDIENNPNKYAYWFKLILKEHLDKLCSM